MAFTLAIEKLLRISFVVGKEGKLRFQILAYVLNLQKQAFEAQKA